MRENKDISGQNASCHICIVKAKGGILGHGNTLGGLRVIAAKSGPPGGPDEAALSLPVRPRSQYVLRRGQPPLQ